MSYSAQDLKSNVENYVKQQLKPFGEQVEITDIRIPANAQDCNNNLKLNINNASKLIGSILVTAKCDSPNWQVSIPVQTKVSAKVVVAVRPINANATITADDISLQNMDLSRHAGNVFLKLENVINKMTKTNIASGQTIRPEQLREKSVIERGDKVKLTIEKDLVNITSEGLAQNSAGIGEKIKIKVQSGKIIDGYVKDKSNVIVHY